MGGVRGSGEGGQRAARTHLAGAVVKVGARTDKLATSAPLSCGARRRGQCCVSSTRCRSRARDVTKACTPGAASILAAQVRARVRVERCTWLLVSTRRAPALARGLHGHSAPRRGAHTQNLRRQSAGSAQRAGQHARERAGLDVAWQSAP